MNTSDDNVDRWVIRCSSFQDAAVFASLKNWHLSWWAWMPAYTLSKNIQVFERQKAQED